MSTHFMLYKRAGSGINLICFYSMNCFLCPHYRRGNICFRAKKNEKKYLTFLKNLFCPGLAKQPSIEAAWDYYEGGTLSIEILKDDLLQRLYFRVKDKVRSNYWGQGHLNSSS